MSGIFNPSIFNNAIFNTGAAVSSSLPAGSGGRGARQRIESWRLKTEDGWKVFPSLDALLFWMSSIEEKEEVKAEVKAERDAKRIISRGKVKREPPQVRIESQMVEVRDHIADMQAKITRVYWRALSAALARQAEEDEDIKFIAELELD